MTVITIFISHRVADLAGKVTEVLLVLRVAFGIGPDVLMAVFALDCIRVLVPGSGGLSRAVEFLAVALGAGQAGLGPVNITRDSLIFPEIFRTDAGTAPCCRGFSLLPLGFCFLTLPSSNDPLSLHVPSFALAADRPLAAFVPAS